MNSEVATNTRGALTPEWNQYIGCILLHMSLPLMPLLIEVVLIDRGAKNTTLTLTLALYAMAIGLSSINLSMFCLCIVLGIVSSVFFGVLSAQEAMHAPESLNGIGVFVWVCLVLVFLAHLTERYFRHVVSCKKFFEFGG
jgi:hypothetical protein